MTSIWLFVVTAGPLLLLAALIYGMFQYSRRRRDIDAVSDAGARKLRRDLEQDDREREQGRV